MTLTYRTDMHETLNLTQGEGQKVEFQGQICIFRILSFPAVTSSKSKSSQSLD